MSKIIVLNGGCGWETRTAGGTISAGDLVRIDGSTGSVVVSTTSASNRNLGVALNDAVSSGSVTVELIDGTTELLFPVETGTAAVTSQGDFADLNSADGLTLTVTNSDVYITRFITTALVAGHVARTARN